MRSLEAVEADLSEVKEFIKSVQSKISEAEERIKKAEVDGNMDDIQRWVRKQDQQQDKENILLQKENKLLDERARVQSAGLDIDAFEERVTRMLDPIKQVCAERISATMSASRATKDKVRTIEEALGVVPGPLDDIENLLGAPPAEGTPEFDWDGGFDATEDQQRQNYAAKIKLKLVERKANPRGFEWIDARGKTLKRTFSGVPFPVSGKNDEVLTMRSYHVQPDLGAVLGMELKKKLTWQALLQMETEFFLWSASSVLPYVQSLTDMNTGGIVCYLDKSGGKRVLRYKIFLSMDEFYDFLASVIKALPEAKELTEGDNSFPEELSCPKRLKLNVVECSNRQGGITQKELWKMLSELQQEEDVACLADVERLEDWGVGSAAVPSYFA